MKRFFVTLVILITLLSSTAYAFDFLGLFRATTGLSTAVLVPASRNSYHFEVGDTLLLPSGKNVELIDVRSDKTIEVSVSGSSRILKLNDYEILNDVKVFYLSALPKKKVQLTIEDFSSAQPATLLNDKSYLFVTGSKLILNGKTIYVSSIKGSTAQIYMNGFKDSISKGEARNLKQLRFSFLGSSLAKGGLTAAKLTIEKARCVDSDNGEQIFTKGQTYDAFGGVFSDRCITITNGVEQASDGCYGNSCYLKEGYCDARYSDFAVIKNVKCKVGCLNNACEEEKVPVRTPAAKSTTSEAKMPALYVAENSAAEMTIAWTGESSKYNVYWNADDDYWSRAIAVSANSYTLKSPMPNAQYGFYVTAIDNYGRESLPSLPIYVIPSTNGKCLDTDHLESGIKGYVSLGKDLISDQCVEDKLLESYCMQDGTYAIKMLEEKGFTCADGKLKAKEKEDCRTSGCRNGFQCTMTNAAQELFECVKGPEEAPAQLDKDEYIFSLEEEIRGLKERVEFLEEQLKK